MGQLAENFARWIAADRTGDIQQSECCWAEQQLKCDTLSDHRVRDMGFETVRNVLRVPALSVGGAFDISEIGRLSFAHHRSS
jgi:hypothetical protein